MSSARNLETPRVFEHRESEDAFGQALEGEGGRRKRKEASQEVGNSQPIFRSPDTAKLTRSPGLGSRPGAGGTPLRFRLEFHGLSATHALAGELGEACSRAAAEGTSLVICTDDPDMAEEAFAVISPLAEHSIMSRNLSSRASQTEAGGRARAYACAGG